MYFRSDAHACELILVTFEIVTCIMPNDAEGEKITEVAAEQSQRIPEPSKGQINLTGKHNTRFLLNV